MMPVFETLSEYGVVPVIAIDDEESAVPLADALIKGGLPVAEITFRTDAARGAIARISAERPQMLLGAGTVLSQIQADAALEAGARFALSPGIDPIVLEHASQIGLPFAPGIMTPSELQIALRHNCELVKFFPAMPAGGPKMLSNIAAPYAHTRIGFNPTGGVSLNNLQEWLSLPSVRAVGGTWIARREDIQKGNWGEITNNARAAIAKVKEIRAAQ